MGDGIPADTTDATIARFRALEQDVELFRASVVELGHSTGGLRRSLDHLSATLAVVPRQSLWRRWRRG
jgi:hypothetical protein